MCIKFARQNFAERVSAVRDQQSPWVDKKGMALVVSMPDNNKKHSGLKRRYRVPVALQLIGQGKPALF